MLLLVQHVRRDHDVESTHVVRKATPIRGARLDQYTGVHQYIERREPEGVIVVVARGHVEPGHRRGDRHEPGSASELQQATAVRLHARDTLREHARRWPDVRPVRESLIEDEVRLADEVVRVPRVVERHYAAEETDLRLRDVELGLE